MPFSFSLPAAIPFLSCQARPQELTCPPMTLEKIAPLHWVCWGPSLASKISLQSLHFGTVPSQRWLKNTMFPCCHRNCLGWGLPGIAPSLGEQYLFLQILAAEDTPPHLFSRCLISFAALLPSKKAPFGSGAQVCAFPMVKPY